MKQSLLYILILIGVNCLSQNSKIVEDSILYSQEKHFKNIRQLTFGGDNAEAYWSYDGKHVIFQRTNPKDGIMCDQIFIGKIPKKANKKFTYKMVSTGKGRTTCAYFLPDGKHILYASTHLGLSLIHI